MAEQRPKGARTRVRGSVLLSSAAFVRQRFGPEAHERVVARLRPEHQAAFTADLREGSWKPVEAVDAYMEAARRLLAPGDASFFREMGRFAGEQARRSVFASMVRDAETAARMLPTMGRVVADQGRAEVVQAGPGELRARISGFPTTPALCERRVGAYEALFGSAEAPVEASETACVLQGSPWCEIRVVWRARER